MVDVIHIRPESAPGKDNLEIRLHPPASFLNLPDPMDTAAYADSISLVPCILLVLSHPPLRRISTAPRYLILSIVWPSGS